MRVVYCRNSSSSSGNGNICTLTNVITLYTARVPHLYLWLNHRCRLLCVEVFWLKNQRRHKRRVIVHRNYDTSKDSDRCVQWARFEWRRLENTHNTQTLASIIIVFSLSFYMFNCPSYDTPRIWQLLAGGLTATLNSSSYKLFAHI